jgi:hypothetical protein
MPTDPVPSAPIENDALVENAMADLAQRLGPGGSGIRLLRHEEVTWADGSLGCPKPGFNYVQVITAGYLIILGSGDREYEYHGRFGQKPFYCASPRPPVPGSQNGP